MEKEPQNLRAKLFARLSALQVLSAIALIAGGTACIYWPAALIITGVLLLADVWMEKQGIGRGYRVEKKTLNPKP